MILKEIGLECEYWLLDEDDNIIEAPKYNFPSDEMGFLVEIRSAWGSNYRYVVLTLNCELQHVKDKAEQLGFRIVEKAWMPVSKDWQDYIAEKYQHAGMPDHTFNIYGDRPSHHTGFAKDRATAGCHVHFSRWDIEAERFIWFTFEEVKFIVSRMDEAFDKEIMEAERIAGEWESKGIGDNSGSPHGFEYRSLPATTDKLKAAKEALRILEELE